MHNRVVSDDEIREERKEIEKRFRMMKFGENMEEVKLTRTDSQPVDHSFY